ncbi:MAG: nucleotidyltransferase [Peptostreptococcaceae bacterium]|nr:nucleotidyltransferase [Peptostreptococcaceae bacterium]
MKPILLIMAAGMGSRYGGFKQIDPITSEGEIIMDFSLYDAYEAGFRKVVFVVRHDFEEAFRSFIDTRAGKYFDVSYAFQNIDDLPVGYKVPEGRTKPWGTCHAVMAAKDAIDAPFAVINADDYYGKEAFIKIYDYLATKSAKENYCMIGYNVENTLSENGSVTRGVCKTSDDNKLIGLKETYDIERIDEKIIYTEDNVDYEIAEGTPVSMNMWGIHEAFMKEAEESFPDFLDESIKTNPMKSEYLLPSKIDELVLAGKISVDVLTSADKWFGVTYKEDKPVVVASIDKMKKEGKYPSKLWK